MNYQQAEKMYRALANQKRLAIISYLNKNKEATVSLIAEHINLSFKSTSRHLRLLRNVGLVESNQIGIERHYYLPNKNNQFIKHALSIV